jgi:hypothetical protein
MRHLREPSEGPIESGSHIEHHRVPVLDAVRFGLGTSLRKFWRKLAQVFAQGLGVKARAHQWHEHSHLHGPMPMLFATSAGTVVDLTQKYINRYPSYQPFGGVFGFSHVHLLLFSASLLSQLPWAMHMQRGRLAAKAAAFKNTSFGQRTRRSSSLGTCAAVHAQDRHTHDHFGSDLPTHTHTQSFERILNPI